MRYFDYIEEAKSCIDNDIVNLLIQIHERNVYLKCLLKSDKYDFSDFAKQAQRESVISSNRMEYAFFNEKSVGRVIEDNQPWGSKEMEICGYNSALESTFKAERPHRIEDFHYLNEHFEKYDEDHREFRIRDRNYTFYKGYKNEKDILTLEPVDFNDIDKYIDLISNPSFSYMWNDKVDFLLVLPICILDFIKIYPLRKNSMQMSRLLMNAMLWGKCYPIVKYVSIERLIEENENEYYQAIADSLAEWEYGLNNYKPFVKYILNILLKAYKEFDKRIEYIIYESMNKAERVEYYILNSKTEVTKKEIMYYCPDISETMIEATLSKLLKSGVIEKVSGGRYTKYRYKRR